MCRCLTRLWLPVVRAQLFFTMMFTYPDFPQSLSSTGGAVDLRVWKSIMINLEASNQTFAKDTYNRLVPEPVGPQASSPAVLTSAAGLGHMVHACESARAAASFWRQLTLLQWALANHLLEVAGPCMAECMVDILA